MWLMSLQVLAGGMHMPAMHGRLFWQTMPQAPQLTASVWRFTSQPLPGLLSQSANPTLHLPTPHWLIWQPPVPLATPGHTLPQAPQLPASLPRSTSQPSFMLPLQSLKPLAQPPSTQFAFTQLTTTWAGAAQALPQPP